MCRSDWSTSCSRVIQRVGLFARSKVVYAESGAMIGEFLILILGMLMILVRLWVYEFKPILV